MKKTDESSKIPKGWERVTEGAIANGDKVRLCGKWRSAKGTLGLCSKNIVIRRAPAKARAKKAPKWTGRVYRAGEQWCVRIAKDGGDRVSASLDTRAEARRLRDVVLAALKGEG